MRLKWRREAIMRTKPSVLEFNDGKIPEVAESRDR